MTNLHTGTENFSVPIALPAGRNGFWAESNFVYSASEVNGPFGLGWSLSVPGLSRQTSRGVPHYDVARDIFVLSGAENLVPVGEDANGATQYRPRSKRTFAHVEHRRMAGVVMVRKHLDKVFPIGFWAVEPDD